MRSFLLPFLTVLLGVSAAHAQSVSDNLPPAVVIEGEDDEAAPPAKETAQPASPSATNAETFTITDVSQDVTADTAAHARDKALLLAERAAYGQLCTRLGAPDNSAKLNDDAISSLVASFEVQSERLSAVRYIGVFTIRFKPISAQKQIGVAAARSMAGGADAKPVLSGPVSHLTVAIQTNSLADWAQIKRRLAAVPQVSSIETLDLGRGLSHVDLAYAGTIDDLRNAVTNQGFVLRQNSIGIWELSDGSMVPR